MNNKTRWPVLFVALVVEGIAILVGWSVLGRKIAPFSNPEFPLNGPVVLPCILFFAAATAFLVTHLLWWNKKAAN